MLLTEKVKLQVCLKFYFTLTEWRPEKIEEKKHVQPLLIDGISSGEVVITFDFSRFHHAVFRRQIFELIRQKTRKHVYVSDNRFEYFIRMSEILY